MQSFLAHMDGRQFGVLWSENNFKILKTFSPFDRPRHEIRETTWLLNARIIKLKNWFLVKLFQDMILKVVILMKPQGTMNFNLHLKLLTSLAHSSEFSSKGGEQCKEGTRDVNKLPTICLKYGGHMIWLISSSRQNHKWVVNYPSIIINYTILKKSLDKWHFQGQIPWNLSI